MSQCLRFSFAYVCVCVFVCVLYLHGQGLGTKLMATLEQLEDLIAPTGSFKAMRHALRTLNPPCIPYLGTFLSDVTFIDDGNPKMLKSKINFVKCRKLAAVIRDIQVYQQTPYLMRHTTRIREAFSRGLENMDDDKLYERSLIVEPREPRPTF
jgi:son of sevenless